MEDNGDKKEDRIRARSDTDIGTSSEEPPTKKNPSYGSQKYWEDRYTSHQAVDQNGTEENSSDAFHSWYFTYDDLSPLILPLILGEGGDGGEDCEDHNVAGHEPPALASNNCGSGNSAENTEDSKGSSSSRDHEVTPLDDGQCRAYATSGGNENAKDGRDTTDDFSEHSADTGDEEASFEDFVEVVDEDDGSANSEPPKPREGLSKLGPVSVLEIGCGDVPLGRNLAKSIDLLASQTGVPSNSILKQVVCIDYAPACIAALKKEQRSTDGQKIQVCYEVGDARKLKYKNESFELILEKGTMDAMLSDDDEGVENCRLIVAESARILSTGGNSFSSIAVCQLCKFFYCS